MRWPSQLNLLPVALLIAGCGGQPSPSETASQTKEIKAPQQINGDPQPVKVLPPRSRAAIVIEAQRPLAETVRPILPEPILPPAKTILPRDQWTVEATAVDALGRIGAAAVPQLVQALADVSPTVRLDAVQALARMGPDASAAVPALITALHDHDENVRREAAHALGQIGPAAKDAVPALMESIKHTAPESST